MKKCSIFTSSVNGSVYFFPGNLSSNIPRSPFISHRKGIRLPSIENYPECSYTRQPRYGQESYRQERHCIQDQPSRRIFVHQCLGPANEEYCEDDEAGKEDNHQWCPSGIFTKIRNGGLSVKGIKSKHKSERIIDLKGLRKNGALSPRPMSSLATVNIVFILLAEYKMPTSDDEEGIEESMAQLILPPQ